ncbi:MAG: hypothetical protein AAF809_09405 [Bacteroidota bacterium]
MLACLVLSSIVVGALAVQAQPLTVHAIVESVEPPFVRVSLMGDHTPAQWEGDFMRVNPITGEDLIPAIQPITGTVSLEDNAFLFVESKRLRVLTPDGKTRFHNNRKSFGYLTDGHRPFLPMGTPLAILDVIQVGDTEVGVVAAEAFLWQRNGATLTALLRENTVARPVQVGQLVQIGPMDIASRIELQAQVRGQQVEVPLTLYGQEIGTTAPLVLWLAPNTYTFSVDAEAYYPETKELTINPTPVRGTYSQFLETQRSQQVIITLRPRRPAPELLQAGENSVRRGANGEAIPLLREALDTNVQALEGEERRKAENLFTLAEETHELQQYAEQNGASPETVSRIALRCRSLRRNLQQGSKPGVRTVLDELLQDIPATHPLMVKYEAAYSQL